VDPKPLLFDVRVLVVDDDDDIRELFGIALREAGAEVRTASDAAEAMRIVLQWPPTVMVSDLVMPTTDGFSLLREVRSMHRLVQIPAIAVSGMTLQKERAAALAAGFQEHAAKPLSPDELVAIVARWAAPGLRRDAS
jgi:hypothetical protein